MEKEPTTTVMYKGIEIPARMKEFSNGVSKLMPINTNRHTLYGIPKPSNLNIDAKIIATARNIVMENKKLSNSERIILAKYVRKGNNAILKGHPIGIVVAFVHEDKLLIGWSKYLEGQETVIVSSERDKVDYAIKSKPKEPLIFTKKDAMLLAIERGLVDTIILHKSVAYTKEKRIIPRSIVSGLDQFIQRCIRYFKRDAFNVIINGEKLIMTTKRTCKYPGCVYYDKKAKHYCCGACANDHYDYERLRKEKTMSKIKREWSYKTSDGKLFTGKFAAKKAKEYQKRLDFRESIKDIIPEARRIFDIDKPNSHEDKKTDEELFIEKINNEFNWDVEDFEEFLNWIIIIYLETPGLSKFFRFIEERFDEYK